MKKAFSIYLLLLFFVFTYSAFSADLIHSFDVNIHVDKSGSIYVEEVIEYDFNQTYRHGIFREIPYKYKKGNNNYNLEIDVIDVKDENGKSYKYKTKKESGRLKIKIGDPDKKISGKNDYYIEYIVENPILYLEKYDELYWNSTGTEWWNVPILESTTRVYFDSKLPQETKTQCFTGSYGSKDSNCIINTKDKSINFISTDSLGNGKGITIDIAVPKGFLKEPGAISKLFKFIKDNSLYTLPIFVFFGLFSYWKRQGKDPIETNVITVRYEPPEDLTPAEAGTLYDERADMIDITSTVIDLAVKGFLKIEEIDTKSFLFLSDKDYKLTRLTDKDASGLKMYEKKILTGLFEGSGNEVLVSELKNKFYKHLPGIEDSIYNQMILDKLFPTNPENLRNIFKFLGFGIVIIGLGFLPGLQLKIVSLISGVLFIIFSRYMPRKTKSGSIKNNHLLGFREFIERVETDRIKRMAEDDPTVFERILPFALVFGLEEKWAEAFSSIFTEPPDWYSTSHYGSGYHPTIFINDLGRSISLMNKSFASSPKNSGGSRGISAGGGFGGGGFSGGGFGGGGGGSW